ncbi:hypothetical protein H9P43_003171 [Blastocladiella emersonii ATCC 22665]|nr:hypothetical protein H9P43_003171 [Blastocladiella emersonii ATCC 22665]
MVKLLSVLAVAAALGSSTMANPVALDDFLNFDKPRLSLDGNSGGEVVNVSLKTAPASRVVVYFDAPNTKFDKCALEFTPQNFNKPQPLTVVSMPYLSIAPAERQVPVTFTAFSDDCNYRHYGKSAQLPTVREKGKTGQCQVTGDPHYRSFDTRALYHYQGEGDFYLVKSDFITIQARQGKCFSKATCIVALAVRYGPASFVIDANQPDPNLCLQVVTTTEGATISKTRSGTTTSVNVAFNAGSNLKVDILSSGRDKYLNVYFDAANVLKGKLQGLCGRFDGDANNDFTGRDGRVYDSQGIINYAAQDVLNVKPGFQNTDLFKFGESWRVPNDDSIFKCRDKCAGSNARLPIDAPVTQCRRPDASKVVCVKPPPTLTSSGVRPPGATTSVGGGGVIISSTSAITSRAGTTSVIGGGTVSTLPGLPTGPVVTTVIGGVTTTIRTGTTQLPIGGGGVTTTVIGGVTTTIGGGGVIPPFPTLLPPGQPGQPGQPGGSTLIGGGSSSGIISTGTAVGSTTSRLITSVITSGTATFTTTFVSGGGSVSSGTAIGSSTSRASTSTIGGGGGSVTTSRAGSVIGTSTRVATSTVPGGNRPGYTYVPLPPSCPKPIVVFPVPPGYRKQKNLPRYIGEEPKMPEVRALAEAPAEVVAAAAGECAKKIVAIDDCDEEVQAYVQMCEADIQAQMNPDAAVEAHRLAYTHVCARNILSQAQEPFPEVAEKARATAQKYAFGTNQCDEQCINCTEGGCVQCRDNDAFEVQNGRCVARTALQYQAEFFAPKPAFRALTDEETTQPLNDEDAKRAAEDPTFNPSAAEAQDTIIVTTPNNNADQGKDGKAASSATRVALSSLAGLAAVVVSVMF